MGYEAACTLTTDGRSFRGIARLERKDLTFRGDTRLTIRLDQIVQVHARDGRLFMTFGDRRAVLELGAEAEKWANRIAHPPSRIAKLGIKQGMRVAVINLEDRELARELASQGAVIQRSAMATALDAVFVGVQTPRDLMRLATLSSRIAPTGAIWVIRAKGKDATITEAQSMAAGKRAGLVDVKVVSFSDTASAEKYVIPVEKRERSVRSSSPAPRTRGFSSSRDRT